MAVLPEIEAAIRLFGTLKDVRLSPEEKELLIAARDARENIVLVEADQYDPWVRVGAKRFPPDWDPGGAAKYRTALSQLIRRGYLEPRTHKAFMLTGPGWDAADKL